MKKAEDVWLQKIEREYSESRQNRDGDGNNDIWLVGNTNGQPVVDSDDSDEDDDDPDAGNSEDGEDTEGGVGIGRDPIAIPEDTDDEEEMAEIRRRVLQSKPFSNPTSDAKQQPERIARPALIPVDSDAESGSDIADNEAFDNIIDATPVTDRTGIQAKERLKQGDASVTFSRGVVDAPKKW